MEAHLALACVHVYICVYLTGICAHTSIYIRDSSFFVVQCCPMCDNTFGVLNPHPLNTRSSNACDHSIYFFTFSADLEQEPLIAG